MYWFDVKRHQCPHFHAVYQGKEAVFDLHGVRLSGDIGQRASRLVKEFAHERKAELLRSWHLAIQGKEVPWIKPIS